MLVNCTSDTLMAFVEICMVNLINDDWYYMYVTNKDMCEYKLLHIY